MPTKAETKRREAKEERERKAATARKWAERPTVVTLISDHVLATLAAIALIAFALIAVFTPTGENADGPTVAPTVDVDAVAEAVIDRLPTVAPTATVAPTPELSTIGDHAVPFGLDCAEDETIAYSPRAGGLDCVHVDTFCPSGQHVGGQGICTPDNLLP